MRNCTHVLRALLCVFVFVTGATLHSYSQIINKGINCSNGDYLGFLEYKPVNYATEGNVKHPLIIFLHGIGERGNGTTELSKVARVGLPRVINEGHPMTFTWNGKTETFLVIMPQCPSKYGMWPQLFVTELIKYAKENLRIDTNRIYLTGLSMGGGGSLRYISTSALAPKTVAATATICAPCTFDNGQYVADAKLPLWLFHAADDSVALAGCTERAYNRTMAANPEVKPLKTIWPTGGHLVWDRVYTDTNYRFDGTLNIYEWFLGQNKSLPVNKLPVAKATGTTSITSGTAVANLSAESSTDADGKIVRYVWKKLSGPAAGVIVNRFGTKSTTDITGLTLEGTYVYELSVVDDRAGFSRDTISVTVTNGEATPNKAPVAKAGSDVTITLPTNKTTVNGSQSSDADGSISTYLWSKVSGPAGFKIVNPNSSTTEINSLVEGTYIFKLKVTDNKGASSEAQVTIKVNPAPVPENKAPVAKAGDDIIITLPTDKVKLDGSASSDADGEIATFEWSKISGPTQFKIESPSSTNTEINSLVEGTYVFKLKITDNKGASSEDQVTVKVNAAPLPENKLPVSKAGNDITITLPVNKVKLDGSASTDTDGNIVKYEWSKISGPSQFLIATASSAITDVKNLVAGTYVFRLRVTDNRNGINDDNVTVKVNPAPPPPNVAPIAQAGPDKTITLPVNEVTVNGSSSTDDDGEIVSYAWSYVSGPSAYTITGINAVSTTIKDLEAGIYKFRLEVKDNDGATSADTIQIKVNEASIPIPDPNKAPVAVISDHEITIQLPTNETQVNGSGSYDEDGSVVSYSWTKISGPASFNIVNKNAASTIIENLEIGTYYFSLTVKDNEGDLSKDTVKIIVNKAENIAPVADAGVDIKVQMPEPAIRLNGLDAYDPDGEIASYSWTQVSGNAGITITNSTTSTPGVYGVKEGLYVFRLTVVDNDGASSSDDVTLTVLPADKDSIPPVNNTDTIPDSNLRYEEKIDVYPNPVAANMNVKYTSDEKGMARVSIYNANGMLVHMNTAEKARAEYQQHINVSHLQKGIYYLEIFIDGKRKTTKFFKK